MHRRCYSITRATLVAWSLSCGASIAMGASEAPPIRPMVLELYTSEGCSSCPPAEALAAELASRADLLVLAFHVDYWDDLGWHDRFSLASATARQRQWARAHASWGVFTPQLIVDGGQSLVGSDAAAVSAALRLARARMAAPASRPFTARVSGAQLLIDVPRTTQQGLFDLYAVSYLPRATTRIARGENAGRTISEVNAVRSVSRLATVTEQGSQLHIALSTFPADASKVAVLLQESGSGSVRAALALDLPR